MQFIPLRLQVSSIDAVGLNLQRDPLYDLQAVALEADDLPGIVGQKTHLPDPQVDQDLGSNSIVSQVRRVAQFMVCLHGIASRILQGIGAQLVGQANSSALLAHVKQYSVSSLAYNGI